jgi:hypothetical protein
MRSSVLPLLAVCYMLQYLDKASLGYASLLDIREDTVCVLHATYEP